MTTAPRVLQAWVDLPYARDQPVHAQAWRELQRPRGVVENTFRVAPAVALMGLDSDAELDASEY
jgi:hypothetical protein